MNKRNLVTSLVASLLVVAAAAGYLISGARPQLGLDLRGGISAIYSPVLNAGEERPDDFDQVLEETISVIRSRVDSLGVAEPEISRQGDDVMVQLPGLEDADRAREIIGTTAKLDFRPVEEVLPPGSSEGPDCSAERVELPEAESGIVCGAVDETDPVQAAAGATKYRVGPAALTGDRIDDAIPTLSGAGGAWAVSLDLDRQGGDEFATITADLACKRDQGEPGLLAIVLDNVVESAPAMNPGVACGTGIQGGSATITVGGGLDESEVEAKDLALVLKTGALPITLQPSTFETVSPTLGATSLRNGLIAGLIGLGLVAIYLLFFYRALGAVAIGALLIFGVLMLGLITALGEVGFSLTLAGVAGIIVSIGITADSSILFFERLRDEVVLGKTVRTAAKKAFDNAFRTNLTGNTTTLAAAIILYFLAVGPVRGFALTLGMATILDILILYFYSRPVVGLLAANGRIGRKTVRAADVAVPVAGGSR